ncbi:hypothetical protein LUZ60_015728 [Juncus effusus]|nr:hypothetical protein LUZ60_015728 [Juncus effusus]
MAQVPKFGNWEANGNVSYTQYFEITRNGGRGVNKPMINPNDPAQNPSAFVGPAPRSPVVGPAAHNGRRSGEMELRAVRKSPARYKYQESYEASPSPSWERERRGSVEGRLRARGQGGETPERGSMVPKFGEWDIKDPSSADGYTQVFNRVRDEKRVRSGPVPVTPDKPDISKSSKKHRDEYERSGFSCFGWCRKQ